MYVCVCAAVTDGEIRSCVMRGAHTVEEVGDACAAGTGCGSCHAEIESQIDVLLAATYAPSVWAA